jgi:two-component system KDP operon response regulator KdpE
MTDVILLATPDGTLLDDYQETFRGNGYDTRVAMDSGMACALLGREQINAAVLIGHRAESAFPLVAALSARPRPLVCVLSVDGADEIALLDAGASICLPLASSCAEVVAWIRALIDLAGRNWPANFTFDPAMRLASFGGQTLRLRPVEFDILLHLARHAGRSVSDSELQRHLWPERVPSPGGLAVTIHTLRAALARVGADLMLRTIPRAGYALLTVPLATRRRHLVKRGAGKSLHPEANE